MGCFETRLLARLKKKSLKIFAVCFGSKTLFGLEICLVSNPKPFIAFYNSLCLPTFFCELKISSSIWSFDFLNFLKRFSLIVIFSATSTSNHSWGVFLIFVCFIGAILSIAYVNLEIKSVYAVSMSVNC